MGVCFRLFFLRVGLFGKREGRANRVACFNIKTGDVEYAPAPNALNKFDVYEKDGAVFIKGEESAIRFGQRDPVMKCQVSSPEEKLVVVGG